MFKSAVFILVLNFSVVRNELSPNFEKCKTLFFYNGVIPSGFRIDRNTRYICQKFNNLYYFATLYDTSNKIPIYSAYRLEYFYCGQTTGLIKWFIEPQVSRASDGRSAMTTQSEVDEKYRNSQAFNEDYKDIIYYERGHLYPRLYTCDSSSTEATYTLTNAVPQNINFNRGPWRCWEKRAKKLMENECNATGDRRYFITGAIPGNQRIRNNVNVPSIMWTAACCVTDDPARTFSFGYYGNNVQYSKINKASVVDLQKTLEDYYKSESSVVLFDEICLLNNHSDFNVKNC